MPEEREDRREEPSLDALVEEVVDGLWLRLRDVILVERRLERFVF